MNVIFMGTPDFAVPALQNLINSHHKVKAVYTAPPKPQGRGMKIIDSPVAALAKNNNINIYTPKTLRNQEVQSQIVSHEADIIIVAAYGLIIPQAILDICPYGCINIHPSLLPKYRGAAPLQRTIINGDSSTAICIMQMDAGVDTGDILMKKEISVASNASLQSLHDQCAKIGADLLIQTLDNIENIKPIPQSAEGVVMADKLQKTEALIDWQASARMIDCQIRGMKLWPGAYFIYGDKRIKVLEAQVIKGQDAVVPGEIMNKEFEVACGKDALRLVKVKPEGKSEMSGKDFLLGINWQKQKYIS